MKRVIMILLIVLISTMFVVGCSSSNESDNSYLSNYTDNMDGMGKKYFINNLEDGNYEIEFTAKEYEYGVLKEEHLLYKSTIEYNGKNSTLKVGVVDGGISDSSFKIIINDAEYGIETLETLQNGYNTGVSLSILNEDKYFNLDNYVAIAAYGIGGENRSTVGLNIDEEFEVGNNNLKDLVVYMKLHKTN
ncbi:MAG: hypothetical protein ACRCXA_14055 [Peptostreptococcaceae bacterium]